MVFGWRKRKTLEKERENTVLEEKDIKLFEIKPLLEETKSLRIKTIIDEVKSFRKKIKSQLADVLWIINELERDNLKVDDIDKHLRMLVVRGKKLVISTVKKETESKFPEINSYADVLAFNSIVTQMLKRIGVVLGRQSRVIHIFAKKYASKLKGHLLILNFDKNEMQALINNYNKLNDDISDIISTIESHNESKKTLEETSQRISDLQNSIEKFDQTIGLIKKDISKLKSTTGYAKYLEVQKKIDNFPLEKNQIKNQIDLQFTKISRPLSKYEYVSSLDKPQKILLGKLVADPFDVLITSNKENIIKILFAVKKGVERGSVSVKDSGKSLSQIDETIDLLEKFIAQITEFTNKKKKLEEGLRIFDINELKQKEDKLMKTFTDKKDADSKIQKLKSEISETEERIPNLLRDIEIKLKNISAIKYRLKI